MQKQPRTARQHAVLIQLAQGMGEMNSGVLRHAEIQEYVSGEWNECDWQGTRWG